MDRIKIVIILCSAGQVLSNYTVIEDECKSCTANKSRVYLKSIWLSNMPASFTCRESFSLASKFGIIVDRACVPEECNGIYHRPIMESFGSKSIHCLQLNFNQEQQDHTEPPSNSLHEIIKMVRDYMEIIFISVVLALLLLKKKMLED